MPKMTRLSDKELEKQLYKADDERIFAVYEALKRGVSFDDIFDITKIDRWFLAKFKNLADMEKLLASGELTHEKYVYAKKMGFLD